MLLKLNDFENCLKRWNHRQLSLMGKITVVKTFALPILIYPLTVLNNPPDPRAGPGVELARRPPLAKSVRI